MKKFIIFIVSILIFIAAIFLVLNFLAGEAEKKRYDEIKEKASDAVRWYLKASNDINVDREEPKEFFVQFSFLISKGYLKREDLMDINNINTCDGYVVYRIENKEVTCLKPYIKCKNYVSSDYDSNTVESFNCK